MRHTKLFIAIAVAAAVLVPFSIAQEGGDRPQPQGKDPFLGFPDLVGGLKATKGCLGVETAQTQSGKNCIFAWFENKKAVLAWYYSDMHQGVMRKLVTVKQFKKPLEHVADDAGPILVIASLTVSDRPHFEGLKIPISQIAIELYQPLPGGTYLGGRFTPAGVKVPHSRDYLKKKEEAK